MAPPPDPSRVTPIGIRRDRVTGTVPSLWNTPAARRRRGQASKPGVPCRPGRLDAGVAETHDPLGLLVRALTPGRDRDLTLRQLAVVLVVHDGEAPRSCCALAEMLAIPRPAMTRALNRLTAMGLVRREYNPACRRNVLVGPTPGGWAFLRGLRDRLVSGEA